MSDHKSECMLFFLSITRHVNHIYVCGGTFCPNYNYFFGFSDTVTEGWRKLRNVLLPRINAMIK